MPTNKPQKGVNLDADDHKLAQAIADQLTETNRKLTNNPRLPAMSLRDAVHMAIEHVAAELNVTME